MRFRSKLTVDAVQWLPGANHPLVREFEYPTISGGKAIAGKLGDSIVKPTDWIVTDELGGVDVVPDYAFRAMYDPDPEVA
jgi:hypothetical protein